MFFLQDVQEVAARQSRWGMNLKPQAGATSLLARWKQFKRGVLHHCCAPIYIKQVEEHPFAIETLSAPAKVFRGGVSFISFYNDHSLVLFVAIWAFSWLFFTSVLLF